MVRLRTPEFRGKVSYVFTEQGGMPPCLSPTSEGSSFERFYFQDLISASLITKMRFHVEVKDKNDQAR